MFFSYLGKLRNIIYEKGPSKSSNTSSFLISLKSVQTTIMNYELWEKTYPESLSRRSLYMVYFWSLIIFCKILAISTEYVTNKLGLKLNIKFFKMIGWGFWGKIWQNLLNFSFDKLSDKLSKLEIKNGSIIVKN